MSGLPLLRHADLDAVYAWHNGAPIRARQFLQHAFELAERLPARGSIFNACSDRYRFSVGLAAALVRRQVTLLPPNQTEDTLARLKSRYADVYCLTDGEETPGALETFPFPALEARAGRAPPVPAIPASQRAVLMFTSGSTGEPVAHEKTWSMLAESGAAEAARLDFAPGTAVLGTVPAQHMYGLESTVLMPLQGGFAIHSGRPFYPADICDVLASLPRPRVLVTTPVHLRALIADSGNVPGADAIVCATAPLAPQLAEAAEARFGAKLYEIYGCTEAGQVASRRTVETAEWQPLAGLELRQDGRGTWVKGGHVHEEVLLNDMIELRGRDRFLLHGRNADLVNIAGKRTSLAHLNYHLNSIPGVRDGVFMVPDASSDTVERLMAFVVAPGIARKDVLEALRGRIDPAFMPRPLVLVPELPRNTTGKLPHAALQALAAEAAARDA